MNLQSVLEKQTIHASVPCRVDFGGTLDISTFYLPMIRKGPSSVNLALDMRTHVTLFPFQNGGVKVSSKGFESAVFKQYLAPFNHPMGLMFAVADYFDVHGVHIHIESTSPPRSALGGSSAAAVAIAAAILTAQGRSIVPEQVAWLIHYIEASVAGVPCGVQDQLAAAFGGVNQWHWKMGNTAPEFDRHILCSTDDERQELNDCMLVAYCGIPHVSKDINSQWVASFVRGETRHSFETICELTTAFASAIKEKQFETAAELMNQETLLRCKMTPEVLDNIGKKLFETAVTLGCGARFTGAGGGGCLWAVGQLSDITALRPAWQEILSHVKDGALLDVTIDNAGIIIH